MYAACAGRVYKSKSGELRIIIGPVLVENGHKATSRTTCIQIVEKKPDNNKVFGGWGDGGGLGFCRLFQSILFNADIRSLSVYRMLLPYLPQWGSVFGWTFFIHFFPRWPAASRLSSPSPAAPLPISPSVHQCVNNWNLINIIERAYEVANAWTQHKSYGRRKRNRC